MRKKLISRDNGDSWLLKSEKYYQYFIDHEEDNLPT